MDTGVPTTNFAVARVKRDILRRSNIGFISTYRSETFDEDIGGSNGSNTLFGVDGNFTFFQNLDINTYWARTWTSGLNEGDTSYLGSVRYGGDRYGVELEHLKIGENFKPEVGFLRRQDIRKTSAELRFSPRATSIPAVRKFNFEGKYDHVANTRGLRRNPAKVSSSFGPTSKTAISFAVEYTRNYEYLAEEFEIADDVFLPIGGYDFQNLRYTYRFRPATAHVGFREFPTRKLFQREPKGDQLFRPLRDDAPVHARTEDFSKLD